MKKKPTMAKKLKRLWRWLVTFTVMCLAVLLSCDLYVSLSTRQYIYTSIKDIPDRSAAVVLGTSKHFSGKINPYYKSRVDAVVQLFAANKVRAVVASGDNRTRQYNEPRMLRKDLIAAGVPSDAITMDFAGFRTLDSIVRAKEVFKLDKFVVVSQRFQVERALYIARAHNIDAIGYVADNPQYFGWRWRVRLREVFARFKAVLDVTVLDTMPKFLGPKVDVNLGLRVPKISLPGLGFGGDDGAVASKDTAPVGVTESANTLNGEAKPKDAQTPEAQINGAQPTEALHSEALHSESRGNGTADSSAIPAKSGVGLPANGAADSVDVMSPPAGGSPGGH